MDLNEYNTLKRTAEFAKEEVDRITGELTQVKRRIKKEALCKNLVEAKKKLSAKQKLLKKHNLDIQKQLRAFEAKWGPYLERI
jgi:hypothetical protein